MQSLLDMSVQLLDTHAVHCAQEWLQLLQMKPLSKRPNFTMTCMKKLFPADADAQPTGKQLEASATNPGAESASTAAPAKNVGQRKASSGLKRGFFAGASRPKSATASSNLEKKAPQAKPTSQNKAHSAKAVDQTAFTGEIVEKPGLEVQDEGQKTAVSKPTDSSNHLSNKETPTLQAVQNNVPKRVSKFKMARSAG